MAEPVLNEELLAFLRSVAAGDRPFLNLEKGIDINALPPKDSLMFGLPPSPAFGTPSFELWQSLATSRTAMGAESGPPLIGSLRTGYNRLGLKGHLETSRNWSGAVISSPYRSRPFDFLIGTWKVPDFRLPAQGIENEYACSTWIGFDGHRRNSRSLPQLGTVQQIIKDGAGSYNKSVRAWWQWWHPDDVNGPNYDDFSDLSVGINENIIACLFSIQNIGVLMKMANSNTGEATKSVLVPAPRPDLEPKTLDAECVLERPKRVTYPYTNFVTPDFDPTTFRCYATLRGETTSRTMHGGRLIRMVHSRDRQMETIATPDPSSRKTVTVKYCLK